MTAGSLSDEDHVIRQVPFSKQVRNGEDECIGVTHHAFTLREGEPYLSVAWCEYFDADAAQQTKLAVAQMRKVRSGGGKTVYWKSQVLEIRRSLDPHKITAFHNPDGEYECHAGLGDWPEEATLLETLAKDAIAELFSAADLD
ncbi:hypothetical protein [Tabrizicola sp.]|uniref:hypothetical protein n=1 Tax=Tabrizicola sp. TaxID=2005166 RepID=UPI0035AFEC39